MKQSSISTVHEILFFDYDMKWKGYVVCDLIIEANLQRCPTI